MKAIVKDPGENCCRQRSVARPGWVVGTIDTAAGGVPRVGTRPGVRDRLSEIRVRWGIGRMSYVVPPGLYAAGNPSNGSPVLVTANYKMSFDRVRGNLEGRDAWILVLDTKGVNVWCAAGKGTFGTDELCSKIKSSRLEEIVSHRDLVAPQLGATGVSAHRVREMCGWRVRFGPVRSKDIPSYLDSGMKAAPEMRLVRFTLADRLVLVPVDLIPGMKRLFLPALFFVLFSGLGRDGYSAQRIMSAGARSALMLFVALIAGGVLSPLLLPWIPGRAFSVKGALSGAVLVLLMIVPGLPGPGIFGSWLEAGIWLLIVAAGASYFAMNFTGASTYTSPSGVRREMRFAVPAQVAAASAGVLGWVIARFV